VYGNSFTGQLLGPKQEHAYTGAGVQKPRHRLPNGDPKATEKLRQGIIEKASTEEIKDGTEELSPRGRYHQLEQIAKDAIRKLYHPSCQYKSIALLKTQFCR
jgi:hypothetical protein